MSDDYILKYTNGYANRAKVDEDELKIDGDCKITNYDPRENPDIDSVKKGSITINFSEEEETIEIGNGKKLIPTEKANFSKKKFSIFREIAALDGNTEELSVDDIKKMNKSLIEKWGLKDLRYDFRNGVATLVWGKDDILRIDFKTWQERWFGESESVKQNENKLDGANEVVKQKESTTRDVYVVKSGDNLEDIAHSYDLFRWELVAANPELKNNPDTLKIGQRIVIPESNVPKKYDDLSASGRSFLAVLAARESTNNKRAENGVGYIGLYQMGEKALRTIEVYKKDATPEKNTWEKKNWIKNNIIGIKDKEDFLNNEDKQHQAVIRYAVKNWIHLKTNVNLKKYIGTTMNGVKITEAGLLAGAHLVGAEAVVEYLKSGGKKVPRDGNKTPVTEYIELAQYEDVSDFKVL